ncbi:hypothetical protein HYPSUDRAFT_40560 [Hypholoma sublateritium FD-334 SS-4]|uniref:Uncharacterized protein n=1 Tax=Hypholoma sublateritium (strain FD-334 SS-4) TaxID=945553 RepID=A0A0D2L6X9_HYPSF|nr:hypothetical protein HYPSUDRAFT_40560 [Hypholoma sublateritium FD-334 SS-4]
MPCVPLVLCVQPPPALRTFVGVWLDICLWVYAVGLSTRGGSESRSAVLLALVR